MISSVRYLFFITLAIGLLIPNAASLASHSHYFTGTYDEDEPDYFVYGGSVTDTVSTAYFDGTGVRMRFKWYDPTGHQVHEEYISKAGTVYESTYSPTDLDGEWKVSVSEVSSDYYLKESDAYFDVSSVPEFTMGSFIAILKGH